MPSPEYIEGLLRERSHYVSSGDQGRVAQVTAELQRCGYEDPAPPVERAVRRPAETRRTSR